MTYYQVTLGEDIKFTEHRRVASETEAGIWLQKIREGEQVNGKFDILFYRDTGKIIEYWFNGVKTNLPKEASFEVLETRETKISVPAGTLDCQYRKIRYPRLDIYSEFWENKGVVPMPGLIKFLSLQMETLIAYELISFKK
ncbi:MAG: hypothetical protein AABZ55_07350 [Bdellovibrionota bacterium]